MLRTWVYWPYVAPTAAGGRDRLRRSGLQLQGPRRVRPPGADPRAGGAAHALGHARTGRTAARARTTCRRTSAPSSSSPSPSRTATTGAIPGFPFVRFYSIWNEPNLAQFLAPQFAGKQDVGPKLYAQLYRAGYAGVKAGEPDGARRGRRDLAARPRQARRPGSRTRTRPGRFAQLVAQQRPAIKFDAWAHHPYVPLGVAPLAPARYPNVTLVESRPLRDEACAPTSTARPSRSGSRSTRTRRSRTSRRA